MGTSLFDVISTSDTFQALGRKSISLMGFANMIKELTDSAQQHSLGELFDELLEQTGYMLSLIALGEEGKNRVENVKELKSMMMKYEEENSDGGLSGFLEEVALYTDLDSVNEDEDTVILMTLHSAKGLEYPNVFIVGMEEGIFPGRMSNTQEELEEERRLAYVGITRAKNRLFLTNAAQRMLFGSTQYNSQSRFIEEIPKELKDSTNASVASYHVDYSYGSGVSVKIPKPAVVGSVGTAPKKEKAVIDYAVGDTVSHKTFGEGVVLKMTPMGNDTLVEVAFGSGTKKIMANFAKLNKI